MKKNQTLTLFAIIAGFVYWILTSFTGIGMPMSVLIAVFVVQFIQKTMSEQAGEDLLGYLVQLIGNAAFAFAVVFVLQAIGFSGGILSVLAVFAAYYVTPSLLGWLAESRTAKA